MTLISWWALWWSVGQQGLSVGTVTVTTVMLGRHSGVRATYIDCSLLVAADICQPIQKMIGTSWLRSADTNNLIFCIDCTMPADTNNPRVERGVTCRCETLTHGENQLRHQAALFPAATLALLTPPSTMTSCCHRLPRCHAIASLNTDVVLSPPPSM
jgi:hypothetical protein